MKPYRALVIIHGIHTSKKDAAGWMPALGNHITEGWASVVYAYRYGWRSGVMMRFPIVGWFSRRRRVKAFQKFVARVKATHPGAEVDVVAHSYGTWIAHYAMTKGKPTRRTSYNRMVYMGSIVHQNEDWTLVPVKQALNLYSPKDKVVKAAPGFGESGEIGFDHADGERVTNLNLTPYSHGDYLAPGRAWDEARRFLKR